MKLFITSALLILAISPLAQAHHEHKYYASDKHHSSTYKAKVVNSVPIYKYVTARQPQTYCEPALVYKGHRSSHDRGATIVGGIVGGLIGHAASDNKHKGLGTIVGAVVGSSVAHKVVSANTKDSDRYKVQRNCKPTYKKTKKVRVLDGYNVTYRSKGKLYQTFMQDEPAKYIRITR